MGLWAAEWWGNGNTKKEVETIKTTTVTARVKEFQVFQ
jgi:hypothetical protein